jgi:hypothetical protein
MNVVAIRMPAIHVFPIVMLLLAQENKQGNEPFGVDSLDITLLGANDARAPPLR